MVLESINFSFYFDLALLAGAAFFTARLIYLRSHRGQVLAEFKRETTAYETANNALRTRWLVIAILVSLAIIAKTIVDMLTIMRAYKNDAVGQLFFLLALGALSYSIIFYAVYRKLKKGA